MNLVVHNFYRGARPSDYAALYKQGVRTVISLQTGWYEWWTGKMYEEDIIAKAANINLIHIPLSDFRHPSIAQTKTVLDAISDALGKGGVLLHCKHGVDRTGWIAAAWRCLRQGWTTQMAIDEWERMGFHKRWYFWWEKAFKRVVGILRP